jgi:DNA polymerase
MDETEINDANSLLEIEKLVSKCERCSLYKAKTKDVPGVGNEKAEVMFIGEGPGKDEDLQGEPFVGAAGQFLNEMIRDLSWKRENVYIANVIKHRAPNNRDPFPLEVEACWPFLKRQIELIEPKLIVFLGRYAMARFFPTMQISKVHGRAFRKDLLGKSQVFLALYHPAAALYNGSMREVLIDDFKKIPEILEKVEEIKDESVVYSDKESAKAISKEINNSDDSVGIPTESVGKKPKIKQEKLF